MADQSDKVRETAENLSGWIWTSKKDAKAELERAANVVGELERANYGLAQAEQKATQEKKTLEAQLVDERKTTTLYVEQKQRLDAIVQQYKTKEVEFTTLEAQLKDLPNAIKARETNLANKQDLYKAKADDLTRIRVEYDSIRDRIIKNGLSVSEEIRHAERLAYLDERQNSLEKNLRELNVDLLAEQRKLDGLLDYRCDLESQKSDKTPQYAAIDLAAAKARENKAVNEERVELANDLDKRAKKLLDTIKQKGQAPLQQTQTHAQPTYVKPNP